MALIHQWIEHIPDDEKRDGEQRVFISYEFRSRDLRVRLERSLKQHNLQPYFADKEIESGFILHKVCKKILVCRASIVDLTRANPNVYFELGVAIGLNKPVFIMLQDGATVPPLLESFVKLRFTSYRALEEELAQQVPGWLEHSIEHQMLYNTHCHFLDVRCQDRTTTAPQRQYLVIDQIAKPGSDGRIELQHDQDMCNELKPALERFHFTPVFLDSVPLSDSYRLCDYCRSLRQSDFALCHLTHRTTPNTYLLLGLVTGIGLDSLLLVKNEQGFTVPTMLHGLDSFRYNDYVDIGERLADQVDGFLNRCKTRPKKNVALSFDFPTFDYLERRWLEKTTGRPAPEWDRYIIKELLDNALDADERWSREHGGMPTLTVDLHYRNNAALKLNSLDIAVSNRAPFPEPAEMLPAIFDLSAYTSNKSHYNYPTRGHQGNALKTILGIPYALRLEHYGDYDNLRKPLVIETGENAWLLTLDIDEKQQQVTVGPIAPEPLATPCAGTCIRVGIDRFVQENPRTLDDLHTWARQFALLNPHATFHWRVTMGQEQVEWEFPADPTWDNLFRDAAPIHWYEYTQVRDLLLALERKHGEAYPLEEALQTFAGFTTQEDPHSKRARALCHRVGYQTLGDLRLTSDHNRTLRNGLLKALLREGRRIGADTLGGLGETQTIATLTAMFALEHPPRYYRIPHDNPDDPYHPFVLELTVARLPDGYRRHIWTGLNHTPTYEDPFYTEQFLLPEREGDYVQGLDGVLDAYRQTSDRPVLLLLHLICPNFTFRDFSKTQIDRRPFREVLVATLHQLLTEFRAAQQDELENLQPVVHALLPNILQTL
jgi:nucleoside 2-deoxyribosyltransferase